MDAPQRKPSRAPKRTDRPLLALRDLLAVVAEARGGTRLELVCWQLNIEESSARPAWDIALRRELLEPHGIDSGTGEALFTLTDRGRRALGVLSRSPRAKSLTRSHLR